MISLFSECPCKITHSSNRAFTITGKAFANPYFSIAPIKIVARRLILHNRAQPFWPRPPSQSGRSFTRNSRVRIRWVGSAPDDGVRSAETRARKGPSARRTERASRINGGYTAAYIVSLQSRRLGIGTHVDILAPLRRFKYANECLH